MRIEVATAAPEDVEADVLAAPLRADARELVGPAAELDRRLNGLVTRLVETGEATGELRSAPLVHLNGDIRAERLVAAGVGPAEAVDADAVRTAASAVVRAAEGFADSVAWVLDESLPLPLEEQAKAVVDGVVLGAYDPARWKSNGRPRRLERLVVVTADPD